MTWQIVFVIICLIVAGTAALLWIFTSSDKSRLRGKTVTIAALAASRSSAPAKSRSSPPSAVLTG